MVQLLQGVDPEPPPNEAGWLRAVVLPGLAAACVFIASMLTAHQLYTQDLREREALADHMHSEWLLQLQHTHEGIADSLRRVGTWLEMSVEPRPEHETFDALAKLFLDHISTLRWVVLDSQGPAGTRIAARGMAGMEAEARILLAESAGAVSKCGARLAQPVRGRWLLVHCQPLQLRTGGPALIYMASDLRAVLDDAFQHLVEPLYDIRVGVGPNDLPVFVSGEPQSHESWTREAVFLGERLQFTFTLPLRARLLPPYVLVILGGVLLAAMVAAALRLWVLARARARLAEQVGAQLRVKARELADQTNRLAAVTDIAVDVVWTWELDSRAIQWRYGSYRSSRLAGERFAASVEELLARVHPDERTQVNEEVRAVIAGGEFWSREYRFQRRDGSYAQVLNRGIVMRENGIPVRLIGALSDLTELKQVERELARANRVLRLRDACNRSINSAQDENALLAEICAHAVAIGAYCSAWVGYRMQPPAACIQQQATAGAHCLPEQVAMMGPSDGLEGGLRAALADGAVVSCSVAHGSDRHDRPQSALMLPLRDSHSCFGVLALCNEGPVERSDGDDEHLHALAQDLAHGINALRAAHEQRRVDAFALRMASLAGDGSAAYFGGRIAELADVLGADGAVLARLLPGTPHRLRTVALWTDQQERPEQTARCSDALCAELLHTGQWSTDRDAGIQLDEVAAWFPWPVAACIGVRLDTRAELPLGMVIVAFRRATAARAFHFTILQILAVRIAAEIERVDQDLVIRGHARMLEGAHDAIVAFDEQGQVSYANASACALYGWRAAEVTQYSLASMVHPGDLLAAGDALTVAMTRGDWSGELRHLGPNGRIIEVESRLSCVQAGPGARAILAINTDIGERRRTARQLQQTLDELQARNRELREFAFVASHDLQEPLRKVRAYGERLNNSVQLDERARDFLERMTGAAGRMQRLIDDLLAYSRVLNGQRELADIDLRRLLRSVLQDLEERLRESGGKVDSAELPVVRGDPVQLRQLLQNLLSNALKYRAPDRAPRVLVAARRVRCEGREHWELTVSDNGIGFPNEFREQIFAPFQRLHGRGEYEGSGIGLAIVRRIVESNGGKVCATGQPGVGARFTVLWPVAPPVGPASGSIGLLSDASVQAAGS